MLPSGTASYVAMRAIAAGVAIAMLLPAQVTGDDAKQDQVQLDPRVLRLWRQNVSLSTDATSASDHFSFVVRAFASPGEGYEERWDTMVVRSGGKVAILLFAENGLPYAYFGSDFAALLDQNDYGRLVLVTGGFPEAVLEMAKGRVVWNISYRGKRQAPVVRFDLNSFLVATEEGDVHFSPSTSEIVSRKGHNTMVIVLPGARASAFPLDRWELRVRDNPFLLVHDVRVRDQDSKLLTAVTSADFEGFELRVERVNVENIKIKPGVPLGFTKSETARRGAAALGRLIAEVGHAVGRAAE